MKRLTVLIFILMLGACAPKLDENGQLAREYLESKGYSIKSYEGEESFIVERQKLIDMPDISIWAVQSIEPDSFIGKEITQEIFIVKDHPLSKIYGSQKSFTNKVEVRVFVFNGEVIGGTSYPVGNGVGGAHYSLDGQTAEEVRKQDYVEWQNKWIEKYGN